MGTTKFEKLDVGRTDVAAFRISGTLGFHENTKVQRLIEECMRREFRRVLFDFTELTSLGGGVAKILREFVVRFGERGGEAGFIVTSGVILEFLRDGKTSFATYGSLEEALGAGPRAASAADDAGTERPGDGSMPAGEAPGSEAAKTRPRSEPGVICMPYDDSAASQNGEETRAPQQAEVATAKPPAPNAVGTETAGPESGAGEIPAGPFVRESAGGADSEEVFSEIFGEGETGTHPDSIDRPGAGGGSGADLATSDEGQIAELNRKLKRRILELKTLFSISKDFNAIRDRKKLLDIFLLTSIAQGGVESAVFLERRERCFEPVMSKGIETDRIDPIEVSFNEDSGSFSDAMVIPLDDCEIAAQTRDALKRIGLEYLCPFRQEGEVTGLVLLGKRIAGRGMKREDFEFLQILVTIAQSSYENAIMFDHEHERTLGIVKTLISLIEENTLLKGTSEFVSRYVGLVAKNMGYAEEEFKDLIYGTVLRDMGMIKVSDLILRSPRDLTKEEWEIIKKHPEDGAEMLERMRFSDRVVGIVKAHHERFNGEGYPMGLVGKEIPLGARIISVVESYAAMIHERPNRPALSDREALDVLKENYGLRYDREVVQHFNRIMEKEIAKAIRPEVPVGS